MTRRVPLLFWCFVVLTSGTAGALLAQGVPAGSWVPLVGKVAKRIYRLTPGGRQLVKESSGVYMRSSSGAVYARDLPLSGSSPGEVEPATLEDLPGGKVYRIFFVDKRAVVLKKRNGAATGLSGPSPQAFSKLKTPDRFVGKKTIAGVGCEEYRVSEASGTGRFGEVCFAPSLNDLVVESKFPLGQDMELLTVFEEIQAGKEPDVSFFSIPKDFIVVDRR